MKNQQALEILKTTFGFDSFRSGQQEIIDQLIEGHSALAVFPTGSGKSLCYQLSALLFEGLSVVVSPLIALMKDQVDFLQTKGIPAAKIDSTLSLEELNGVWKDVESSKLKLLYIAPERFSNEKFLQRLQKVRISMMVIDEAHCLSEWGHNFRPDYLKLNSYVHKLKAERVLALTATATPKVANDICRTFNIPAQAYINTGYYRPNLILRMTRCNKQDKVPLLLKRLQSNDSGPTIIYVTLQKEAEKTAEMLSENGYSATAYHAGLKGELRHQIQENFMSGKSAIIVATIAFGMGIDKSDIRYVYHLNIPKSMENYAQEIGRAGRDGKSSICEVFASQNDSIVLSNFTYGDTPTLENIKGLLENLFAQGEKINISVYQESFSHDIRTLVINTLLCYLELKEVIQSTGHFYNTFKFQTLLSSQEIFAKFDPERAQFLKTIFRSAKEGRTWSTLDIMKLAEEMGSDRLRITSALNFLDNEGMLKTQVSDVRTTYRQLIKPENLNALAEELFTSFFDSEQRNIQRLNDLVKLTKQGSCLVNSLLEYFGEKRESPCGHCDRCLKNHEDLETISLERELSKEDLAIIKEAKFMENPYLEHPRNLAKFLCGINSPAASRQRPILSRHKLFGSLRHVPFKKLMAQAAS